MPVACSTIPRTPRIIAVSTNSPVPARDTRPRPSPVTENLPARRIVFTIKANPSVVVSIDFDTRIRHQKKGSPTRPAPQPKAA